jgi:hypothetical protein
MKTIPSFFCMILLTWSTTTSVVAFVPSVDPMGRKLVQTIPLPTPPPTTIAAPSSESEPKLDVLVAAKSSTTTAKSSTPSRRRLPNQGGSMVKKPKWGVDKDCSNEYWLDHRIHTLGNVGFWGAVHAAMAPMATRWIDMQAYDGVDIRKKVRTTKYTKATPTPCDSTYTNMLSFARTSFPHECTHKCGTVYVSSPRDWPSSWASKTLAWSTCVAAWAFRRAPCKRRCPMPKRWWVSTLRRKWCV